MDEIIPKYSEWLADFTFENCAVGRKPYGEFLASIPESTYLKNKETLIDAECVTVKEWRKLAPKHLYSAISDYPRPQLSNFKTAIGLISTAVSNALKP